MRKSFYSKEIGQGAYTCLYPEVGIKCYFEESFDKWSFVHTMGDMSKTIKWNAEKEKQLQEDETRSRVSFSDCVIAIEEGRVLNNLAHPTRENQRMLILNIEDYAYVVPYVLEEDGSWFLKTVFPSRKHTALYLTREKP